MRDMSEEETKVIAEEKEEETADDSASMPPPPEKSVEIEKMEEQKLKSKFPGNHRVKGWTGSSMASNCILYSKPRLDV